MCRSPDRSGRYAGNTAACQPEQWPRPMPGRHACSRPGPAAAACRRRRRAGARSRYRSCTLGPRVCIHAFRHLAGQFGTLALACRIPGGQPRASQPQHEFGQQCFWSEFAVFQPRECLIDVRGAWLLKTRMDAAQGGRRAGGVETPPRIDRHGPRARIGIGADQVREVAVPDHPGGGAGCCGGFGCGRCGQSGAGYAGGRLSEALQHDGLIRMTMPAR